MIKYLNTVITIFIYLTLNLLQLGLIILFLLFLSGSSNEEAVNLFILFNCDQATFFSTISTLIYSILIITGLASLRLLWLLYKEKK